MFKKSFQCLGALTVLTVAVGGAFAVNPGAVVINEIWNGSTASDEYVEFYNTTAGPVDVSAWTFVRRSNAAASDDVRYTFPGTAGSNTTVIPSHGYYVMGDAPIGVTINNTPGSYTNVISSTTNQSLGLKDALGNVVDGVGNGTGTLGAGALFYTETTAFPNLIGGNAGLARVPNGTDVGNNSTDFVATSGGTKTPGISNDTPPSGVQATSIQAVKNLPDSTFVFNTSGTVVNVGGNTGRLSFVIADATGGIIVDRGNATYTQPNVGDKVNITSGTKSTFISGLLELQVATNSSVVVLSSGNPLPAPQVLTVAGLNPATSASLLTGNYVRVKDLHSIDIPAGAGVTTWLDPLSTSSGLNYTYSTDSGSTLAVRLQADLHNTTPTWEAKTRPVSGNALDRVDIVTVVTANAGINQLQLCDPVGTTAKTDGTGPIQTASDPPPAAVERDWVLFE